jgi:ketosteroid isomerase-like protein
LDCSRLGEILSAMVQGHVAIANRTVDAYDRGDWDVLGSLIAADAQMTPFENWPEPGPFIGRDEMVRELQRLRENFEGRSKLTLEEATEHGEWVVGRYRWTVEGAASGVLVDASLTGALRLSDGQFVEVHWRFDHEKAIEAAGLSK